MMFLLSLTLLGALIGWGSIRVSLFLLAWKKAELGPEIADLLHQDLLTEENLRQFAAEFDLEKEISPLVSAKMDQLTLIFTQRFPMLGMFLTPEIAAPFKKTGQEEILRMLPELQDKLLKRAATKDLAECLSKKLCGHLENIVDSRLFQKLLSRMQWIGIATGALIGLAAGSLYLFFAD